MARRYGIETPMQLRMLAEFSQHGADSPPAMHCKNVATVWNAFRNKGRKVDWDGRMFVVFETMDGKRSAYVMREYGAQGDKVRGAIEDRLKYNPALAWCRENLNEVTM